MSASSKRAKRKNHDRDPLRPLDFPKIKAPDDWMEREDHIGPDQTVDDKVIDLMLQGRLSGSQVEQYFQARRGKK